jgi:hypothetical protein
VIVTPKKQGAQTIEANTNAGLAAARQTVAFFKDGDTTFCVYKVIPVSLKGYATLAVQLGRLAAVYVSRPRQVFLTAYGELDSHRGVLGDHVLKGVLTAELGREVTPSMAAAHAAEQGVEITGRQPDDSKGYGNALTIEVIDEGGVSFGVRGRIDEGQMEASRIGQFKARMPLDPGLYVLASYKEGSGMADRVGRYLIDAGFNRVVLGAGPNMDHSMAQAFFMVEKDGVDAALALKELGSIAGKMRETAGVAEVRVVNLMG